MHKIGILLVAVVLLSCTGLPPAQAEIGPCGPVADAGVICGHGAGAARVVDGTTSPSGRLAFAWRSRSQPPSEIPDHDDVESLLIRLADGVVLWRTRGDYWSTGEARANRWDQSAAWSPNSRLAVETLDFRWWTEALRLYAIGPDDRLRVLDLKAVIEPAVRRHLRRMGKNERDYAFSIFGSANGEAPHLTIDDSGVIRALVLMVVPKSDPYVMLEVAFRVSPGDGPLAAREVSVRRSRVKPW